MTIRLQYGLLRGVIRNDVHNTVDGWLQPGTTAAPQPPVLLSLVGNLPGPLAGKTLIFDSPATAHTHSDQFGCRPRLHPRQIGVFSRCLFRPAPENNCSLAWHGPDGLVRLHAHNCQLLSGPADTASPDLTELQLDCLLANPDEETADLPPLQPLPVATHLPDPDSLLTNQQAWLVLQPLLARLARAAVSYHLCPHCSSRDALRQIIRQVLPQLHRSPQPPASSRLRSFSSADICSTCQHEFRDLLAPLSVSLPEKPRNPPKQPFPVSGSGSRIWNSGSGSTSMTGW
ncbi:MAG: hypothetical protein ACKO3T_02545 [Planctomycetaceae bacterium]